MEQFVTIELFGQPYTFKAEAEASEAKEVADFLVREVDKLEIRLSGKSPTITKQTILILAALNIASEHYNLKKEHSDLLRVISERSKNLICAVDRYL
ncbi:cell division protein ZapA [Desulfococcaceae bacterium HSG8]|nr:cell division protein ZapA [Desulfococcaceae bacterium HSG8]